MGSDPDSVPSAGLEVMDNKHLLGAAGMDKDIVWNQNPGLTVTQTMKGLGVVGHFR